jgi:hypothetical protein
MDEIIHGSAAQRSKDMAYNNLKGWNCNEGRGFIVLAFDDKFCNAN